MLLIRSRLLPYFGAAMIAVLALAACGGGNSASSVLAGNLAAGSGGSANSGGTAGGTAPTLSARNRMVGSALSLAGASVNINELASPNGAVLFAFQQAVSLRGAFGPSVAASPTCDNGMEASWSSSGGVFSRTLEIFYDGACADPYLLETLRAPR